MAQIPKVIELNNTFVPVDPRTFPQNLVATEKQDAPYRSAPIVAYEGYNFLPTSYGYKSYFGTNATFNIPPIPIGVNVDRLFIVATLQYTNFFVALCDTGIYTNTGQTDAAWVHAVTLVAPTLPLHKEWTIAVTGNFLHFYRQGDPSYYTMEAATDALVDTKTPNFLNMEGQRGIFKAGSRLGFWDSEGSIAWSSLDDYEDFVPDAETLAGSAIFNEVKGPIVVIHQSGDGFVIYSTNSIIYVERDLNSTMQWNPSVVIGDFGIAYSSQVVRSSPDITHFAYTAVGFYKITKNQSEPIIQEVVDLLKESLYPIGLDIMENRYLVLQIVEDKFIEGLVEFDTVTYDSTPYIPGMTAPDLSVYPDQDVANLISIGALDEQQAQGLAAALAAGYDISDIGSAFAPTWRYQLKKRKLPYRHPVLTTQYGYDNSYMIPPQIGTVPSSGAALYAKCIMYNNWVPEINLKPVDEDDNTIFEAKGPNAINQFISHYRYVVGAVNDKYKEYGAGALALPFSAIMSYPNPNPNVNDPLASTAYGIDTSEGTTFTWNSCKVSGNEVYTKARAYSGGKLADTIDTPFALQSALNASSACFMEITSWAFTTTLGAEVSVPAIACALIGGLDFSSDSNFPVSQPYPWQADPIDFDEFSITLQNGSPGPVYPIYAGALVYDMMYKKWGKMKCRHRQLCDLSPINTAQGNIVSTKRFGINAAALMEDDRIHRFDMKPTDSYIKYGKIGYYRLGMTTVEEVIVKFRLPCTGQLVVDGSLDGQNPEASLNYSLDYTDTTTFIGYPSMSARWHTISLKGIFDLTGLEYRGYIAGRR